MFVDEIVNDWNESKEICMNFSKGESLSSLLKSRKDEAMEQIENFEETEEAKEQEVEIKRFKEQRNKEFSPTQEFSSNLNHRSFNSACENLNEYLILPAAVEEKAFALLAVSIIRRRFFIKRQTRAFHIWNKIVAESKNSLLKKIVGRAKRLGANQIARIWIRVILSKSLTKLKSNVSHGRYYKSTMKDYEKKEVKHLKCSQICEKNDSRKDKETLLFLILLKWKIADKQKQLDTVLNREQFHKQRLLNRLKRVHERLLRIEKQTAHADSDNVSSYGP